MLVRNLSQSAPVSRSRRGFTLTEMLVVVAIIVVLAGIAVPITMGVLNDAKKDTAHANIVHIVQAINTYYMKVGTYPQTLDEVVANPACGLKADTCRDPWGQVYQYSAQSSHGTQDGFDVWTTAPDGEVLGNWKRGQ